jgi:septal ring factor EnvC (AmiA/AmiB activator)
MLKRILTFLSIIIVLFIFTSISIPRAYADELDDLNKQISELTDALNKSIAATKPLENELNNLTANLNSIKARIELVESDISNKKKNIDEAYESMEEKQKSFAQSVRSQYVKSYYNTPVLAFLSSDTASSITKILAYQLALANRDKNTITNLAISITDLEDKRIKLENEQTKLIVTKKNLDEQSGKLDKLVKGAGDY